MSTPFETFIRDNFRSRRHDAKIRFTCSDCGKELPNADWDVDEDGNLADITCDACGEYHYVALIDGDDE